MDVLSATEQFLETIQDPAKKHVSMSQFERTAIQRVWDMPDMKIITFRLVAALREEADPQVKYAIFWVLETAVCYCNQADFIDWDVVIEQLPLLWEDGLLMA